MKSSILFALALSLVACSKDPPTAMGVCKKLEETGVASKCESRAPSGIGAAAIEAADFRLANGEGAQVLTFRTAGDLEATESAFTAAAVLAGPHRYSSKEALVFVQMNLSASKAEAEKVQSVLSDL